MAKGQGQSTTMSHDNILHLFVHREVRVAVIGCVHGLLDDLYDIIKTNSMLKWNAGPDLVTMCGDFQSFRNITDLKLSAMPEKRRWIGDFYKYYTGRKTAPFLTVFIGGNHEASNYLFELYYGGYVAPNIYYLGAANVVNFGPIRIAALSGIWKGYQYHQNHFERLPYNEDDRRSVYHQRELDVRKLLMVRTQVDIGVSHDWPQNILHYGNMHQLLRFKPGLKEDANSGELGSPAIRQILERLRPHYFFSAHLHARFIAGVDHATYNHIDPRRPADHRIRDPPPASRVQQPTTSPLFHSEKHASQQPEATTTQKDPQELQNIAPPKENEIPASSVQHDTPPEAGDESNQKKYAGSEAAALASWGRFAQETQGKEIEAEKKEMAGLERRKLSGEDAKKPPSINYVQTWKKVDLGEKGNERKVASVHISSQNPDAISLDSDDDQDQGAIKDLIGLKFDAENAAAPPDSKEATNPDETNIDAGSSGHAQTNALEHSRPQSPNLISFDGANDAPDLIDLKDEEADAVQHVDTRDDIPTPAETEGVSDALRAQLLEYSTAFNRPEPVRYDEINLPEGIKNTHTEFIALSKLHEKREYSQTLDASVAPDNAPTEARFKLEYDREWLAIQRVFASELKLGGDPKEPVPRYQGYQTYLQRIIEEEKWIEQNVTDFTIPDSFTITAEPYDPIVPEHQQSYEVREYTNPQTSAYCRMIGIENKFDIPETERETRIQTGPREAQWRSERGRGGYGGRGGGRGSRGGRGGGRGGFGGGRGGQPRGRRS